jgi:hypothetical protein
MSDNGSTAPSAAVQEVIQNLTAPVNNSAVNVGQSAVSRGHRSSETRDRLQRRLAELREARAAPKTPPVASTATPEQMEELRRIGRVCKILHPELRYTN